MPKKVSTVDYYVDIRILADPEFEPTLLLNALFAKLHRALVQTGTQSIGISFPCLPSDQKNLGDCLRLHGMNADLEQFMASGWLIGMRDHILVQGPLSIPRTVVYRVVRRVQVKSNPARLQRRWMRRHGSTCLLRHRKIETDLPFLQILSQSTGEHFRLFIKHCPVSASPVVGKFSYYGLSATATVPWF
ncbi:CRISPR-associated endonuclease Cas6/Csy4 [Gammaproteobacteria bacterium]